MLTEKNNPDMKNNEDFSVLHNEIKTEVLKLNKKNRYDDRLYSMIQTYSWYHRKNYKIESLQPEKFWDAYEDSGRKASSEIHFNFRVNESDMTFEMRRNECFYGIVISNIKNINGYISGGKIEFHSNIYIKENNGFVNIWNVNKPSYLSYLESYRSFLKDLNEDLPKFIDKFEAAVQKIEEKENSDDREI